VLGALDVRFGGMPWMRGAFYVFCLSETLGGAARGLVDR